MGAFLCQKRAHAEIGEAADDIKNIIDGTEDIQKEALTIEKYEEQMKKYFAKLVPIGVISFKMAGSYFFSEPADIGHVISKYFATKPVNDSEGDEIP